MIDIPPAAPHGTTNQMSPIHATGLTPLFVLDVLRDLAIVLPTCLIRN